MSADDGKLSQITANTHSKGEINERTYGNKNSASVDYVCMTVNMETRQVEDLTVNIPNGATLTEKARIKAITEALPASNTFVQVISEAVKETLYGMTEEQFIKLAKVLPPRAKSDSETE